MLAPKAFFSFTEVTDPSQHGAYNEWHQLDHRPENLALPGVRWGERWVHSPDCVQAAAAPDPNLAALHYVNMYWFREPVDTAIAAWSALAEQTYQLGRRDDVHLAERLLLDFFRTIKGYVNPRTGVSVDALPFRPNRGIHLTVTRIDDPRRPAAEQRFGWWDRVRIPAMLRCTGAAGAYTFASESTFTSALDLSGDAGPPSTRIVLVYLDDDPLAFSAELAALGDETDPSVETLLFSGALRAITPWQWDWFDD